MRWGLKVGGWWMIGKEEWRGRGFSIFLSEWCTESNTIFLSYLEGQSYILIETANSFCQKFYQSLCHRCQSVVLLYDQTDKLAAIFNWSFSPIPSSSWKPRTDWLTGAKSAPTHADINQCSEFNQNLWSSCRFLAIVFFKELFCKTNLFMILKSGSFVNLINHLSDLWLCSEKLHQTSTCCGLRWIEESDISIIVV